jgi:hypothetical protein
MGMGSDLLKRLMSRGRTAMMGGDDVAGIGKAFKTGGTPGAGAMGGAGFGGGKSGTFGPGGAKMGPEVMSGETGLEVARPMGGALTMGEGSMRPLDTIERLKMMLQNMSPSQRAALMAGGAGVGAGGLGGYMAGGDE